jgi:hypothetical protein
MFENPNALSLLSIVAFLLGGIRSESFVQIAASITKGHAAKRTLLRVALLYEDSVKALQVLSPIRSHILQYHPLDTSHVELLESVYFQLAEPGDYRSGDEDFLPSAAKALSKEESNLEAVIA